MRHAIHATAAVITLACTGGAMAQWCDGTNGNLGNWCGAIANYDNLRYAYSRATDRCTAYFSLRWSNLRYCTGEVASDVTIQPNTWQVIPLPARGCVGSTSVYWNHPQACGLEYWPLCPGNSNYRNVPLNCSTGDYQLIYAAPPAQPGRFWLSYEPCPGMPGMKHAVLGTSTAQGGTPSYAVEVERTVVAAQGAGAERIGSRSTIALGANDSVALGSCAPEGSYTKALYGIRETCNGYPYNLSKLLVNEWSGQALGGPNVPPIDVGTIRGAITTRLNRRGNFHVRTPSAVMGVRGFAAAETVLEGYAEDPALQIRWQRILDGAQPENGIVPIELLEDGPLVGGSSVTGTHGPVLRLTGFTEHDVGTYLMRVIPAGGTINDAEIVTSIRVVDDVGQPFFTEEPRTRTVCPSQISLDTPISFTAPAVATSNDPDDPIVYQWYVNGEMVATIPPAFWNSSGDAIWLSDPYGWGLGSTSGPRLDIFRFALGKGTDIHNVVFWLECEAMNSHGSSRTRPIPFVIDIDTDDCDGNGTTDACEIAAGAADANADGIPDTCQCLADINGDGMADGADLGQLLSQWGAVQPNSTSDRCDMNADGRIDGADLGVMLSGWGSCGG